MKVHNVNKKAVLAAALMTALSSSTFAAGVGNNVDAAAAAQGAEAFGHGNTLLLVLLLLWPLGPIM